MEENNQTQTTEPEPPLPAADGQGNGAVRFLADMLRGVAIGIAFIIPGFSGGSVAAILGIYEKLIGAITGLFKSFKKNILILLPILLGMVLGIAALIFPIQWGLKNYPIPTVTLFVGLALGGLPSVTEKVKGEKPTWKQLVAGLVALAFAAMLSFLPLAGEVDLFDLSFGGYLLLIVIGFVGSSALIVPGISGSMLLLIFGYYNPVVRLVTENLLHGQQVGICIAVLVCLLIGLVVGFFAVSFLMKFLLKKFPRGTYFAIIGFIVGSVPAVYASTIREADAALSALYSSPWYWVVTVILFAVGLAASLTLVLYARRKKKQNVDQKAE